METSRPCTSRVLFILEVQQRGAWALRHQQDRRIHVVESRDSSMDDLTDPIGTP